VLRTSQRRTHDPLLFSVLFLIEKQKKVRGDNNTNLDIKKIVIKGTQQPCKPCGAHQMIVIRIDNICNVHFIKIMSQSLGFKLEINHGKDQI
jgi:hypothetical protein